jgi:hypothetical protein
VLAPSPIPALTQKHVSTPLNNFKLGLQFLTKQNYSFLLVKRLLEHTVYEIFIYLFLATTIQKSEFAKHAYVYFSTD